MILGMSTGAFTTLHVIISLIGILAGAVVVLAMCAGKRVPGSTVIFLAATVLTSATGFLFHSAHFGPPHIIGLISLVVLAIAIIALYVKHLAGEARWIYIATAILALYFNALVAVIQAFQKLPSLHALAPTQKEPPFLVAQGLLLVAFVVILVIALKRFPARTVRAVV
jgi:hypothetical protein